MRTFFAHLLTLVLHTRPWMWWSRSLLVVSLFEKGISYILMQRYVWYFILPVLISGQNIPTIAITGDQCFVYTNSHGYFIGTYGVTWTYYYYQISCKNHVCKINTSRVRLIFCKSGENVILKSWKFFILPC